MPFADARFIVEPGESSHASNRWDLSLGDYDGYCLATIHHGVKEMTWVLVMLSIDGRGTLNIFVAVPLAHIKSHFDGCSVDVQSPSRVFLFK